MKSALIFMHLSKAATVTVSQSGQRMSPSSAPPSSMNSLRTSTEKI